MLGRRLGAWEEDWDRREAGHLYFMHVTSPLGKTSTARMLWVPQSTTLVFHTLCRAKESIWWAMASLAASTISNTSSPGSFIPYFMAMSLQPESSRVCSSASASIWPEVALAALARTLWHPARATDSVALAFGILGPSDVGTGA